MTERVNFYAQTCHYCGATVEANEGIVFTLNGAWKARHKTCTASTPKAPGFGAVQAEAEAPSKDALQTTATQMVSDISAKFLALVPDMVKTEVQNLTPRSLEIKVGTAPKVTMDKAHKALPDLLIMVTAGASPFLVGPAGSGKTTLAEQIAKVLKVDFYMAARVTSDFQLMGFSDVHGKAVRTQFREAYEHGGVFLFDEVDASDPDAMTAFNAALANGIAVFPDALVKKHPKFYAIAAGNTFGRGADRQYVGRNQLDAATLDRFQTYEVDYDPILEVQIAGNAEWTAWVQKVRSAVDAEKIRHIVSPRASIAGAKLLAAGMELSKVQECCVWKGLGEAEKNRILARVRS